MTNANISARVISPEEAEEILSRNLSNRNLTQSRVRAIAEDILEGRWAFDGTPIRLDEDGVLLDGQHRLSAIVRAGRGVETLVISGLPRSSQLTVDTGKPRSLADQLKILGETNAVNLAAGIRMAYIFGVTGRMTKSTANDKSIQFYIDFLDKHPEIRESVSKGNSVAQKVKGTSGSIISTFHLFASKLDSEDADEFLELLKSPSHPEGSPALAAREAFRAEYDRHRGKKPDNLWIGGILIKAWNAWREGREVKYLRFRPGGKNPETYPQIR